MQLLPLLSLPQCAEVPDAPCMRLLPSQPADNICCLRTNEPPLVQCLVLAHTPEAAPRQRMILESEQGLIVSSYELPSPPPCAEAAWQRFYKDCANPPKKAADVAKYCSLNKLTTANKQELQLVSTMGRAPPGAAAMWCNTRIGSTAELAGPDAMQ